MNSFIAAIDPLALIFPERIYLILVEIRHPNTPLTTTLAQLAKEMTPAEHKAVLAKVRALTELTKAVSASVEHVAEKSV